MDERAQLARTWLARPVEAPNAHAYLTLQGADIPSGYIRVHDAFEIYSADVWRSVVAGSWDDAPDGWEPPPHLSELGEGGEPFIPFVQYAEVESVTQDRELPRNERLARFQPTDDIPGYGHQQFPNARIRRTTPATAANNLPRRI